VIGYFCLEIELSQHLSLSETLPGSVDKYLHVTKTLFDAYLPVGATCALGRDRRYTDSTVGDSQDGIGAHLRSMESLSLLPHYVRTQEESNIFMKLEPEP
jgi:hypothetical protein